MSGIIMLSLNQSAIELYIYIYYYYYVVSRYVQTIIIINSLYKYFIVKM